MTGLPLPSSGHSALSGLEIVTPITEASSTLADFRDLTGFALDVFICGALLVSSEVGGHLLSGYRSRSFTNLIIASVTSKIFAAEIEAKARLRFAALGWGGLIRVSARKRVLARDLPC